MNPAIVWVVRAIVSCSGVQGAPEGGMARETARTECKRISPGSTFLNLVSDESASMPRGSALDGACVPVDLSIDKSAHLR